MRLSVFCLMVLAVLPALPCAAQELRPESVARFGGRYSTDCRSPAAAEALIDAQQLVVRQGGGVMRTPNQQDSFVSFGAAPTSPVPQGYQVEFVGEAFSLYVFQDADGYYVPLAGYVDAVAKVVDARSMKARLRRCPSLDAPAREGSSRSVRIN